MSIIQFKTVKTQKHSCRENIFTILTYKKYFIKLNEFSLEQVPIFFHYLLLL